MGVEIVDVESLLKKIPFDTIKSFYLDVEKASSRRGNLTNGLCHFFFFFEKLKFETFYIFWTYEKRFWNEKVQLCWGQEMSASIFIFKN